MINYSDYAPVYVSWVFHYKTMDFKGFYFQNEGLHNVYSVNTIMIRSIELQSNG